MRPTGRLHLGNYMGALYNWVKLQNETGEDNTPAYECFFFIADFHALTTDYADTAGLGQNILDVALDFLAAGLHPARSTIFRQKDVPAHFALNDLLAMITPLSWLERVPTYKDQQEQLKEKDLATFGFLGYPLLQSADILIYRAEFVPVGQDQAAHVEITREIARRFNHLYGGAHAERAAAGRPDAAVAKSDKERLVELEQRSVVREILPEPRVLLTPSPKLPGTDGRKMSKSYGNTILLSDPEAEIRGKLKTMVTDPARVRRTDPGNPEVCPVFDLHRVFSAAEVQAEAAEGCRTAGIGCIQCKGWLADGVVRHLAPIQERRRHFEAHPEEVRAILDEGAARARETAGQTLAQVYAAVGLE
ncbi:MAG: tryptophan--tRNA ligase [Acidobacteriota bacterium]|nr:tryptophan--tRNA ligase [Acidobacteriota bacterium]